MTLLHTGSFLKALLLGKPNFFWKRPSDQLHEILFPKHALNHDEIMSMLNDNHGSLNCKSKRRNGCFDIEGGRNYESLSFKPGSFSKDYQKSLQALISLARKITKESSTGSVQTKYRVNWKTGKKDTNLEKTLLFCRHLYHLQLGKFANFLTKCDINFHCNARSTFVIDVDGIDASVLV